MSAMPEIDDRTVIDCLMFNFSAGIEHFRECMKQYFSRDGRSIDKYDPGIEITPPRIGDSTGADCTSEPVCRPK